MNSSIGRWIYIVLHSSLLSADRKALCTFGSLQIHGAPLISIRTQISLPQQILSRLAFTHYLITSTMFLLYICLHMTCPVYFFKDSSETISLISFSPNLQFARMHTQSSLMYVSCLHGYSINTDLRRSVARHPKGRIHQRHFSLKQEK